MGFLPDPSVHCLARDRPENLWRRAAGLRPDLGWSVVQFEFAARPVFYPRHALSAAAEKPIPALPIAAPSRRRAGVGGYGVVGLVVSGLSDYESACAHRGRC